MNTDKDASMHNARQLRKIEDWTGIGGTLWLLIRVHPRKSAVASMALS
jgi:hypothetical protein